MNSRLSQRLEIEFDDEQALQATLDDISAGGLGITVPDPLLLDVFAYSAPGPPMARPSMFRSGTRGLPRGALLNKMRHETLLCTASLVES